MFEGDVFGEMSCMTLAPRSATVMTDADCYMVEFSRTIFDSIQKDAGYQQRMGKIYEDRVLSSHHSRLEIFHDLSADQIARLRETATLETVAPGHVICDEGDPSDCVYIIRNGLVQVVKGLAVRMQSYAIDDWGEFCQQILAGGRGGQVPTTSADQPKQSADAGKSKPSSGKMTPADILAAARTKKASERADTGNKLSGESKVEVKEPRLMPSSDDILAKARGQIRCHGQ